MAPTGIYWHEAADQAAGWLASGESTADVTYDSPSNSKSGMHWPHQVTKKQNNTRHGIACATPIAGVGGTLKNFVCQHNKDGPEEVMLVMITGVRSLTCCITSYPNQLAVYLLFFLSGRRACPIRGGLCVIWHRSAATQSVQASAGAGSLVTQLPAWQQHAYKPVRFAAVCRKDCHRAPAATTSVAALTSSCWALFQSWTCLLLLASSTPTKTGIIGVLVSKSFDSMS